MPQVWEFIFMMFVLKLPIVYLCVVVYWAIKAEPRPLEGAARLVENELDPKPWSARGRGPRRHRRGSHGSPSRTYSRARRAALARAELTR